MGIFDSFDSSVSTKGSRQDDQTGTYWQLINKIQEEETFGESKPYLKVYKTTIHVVDDPKGEAQVPGTETNEAYFPNKKFKFFEKETKKLVKAALDLTTDEADALNAAQMAKILTGLTPEEEEAMAKKLKLDEEERELLASIDNRMLEGRVLLVRCVRMPKKDKPDEFFTNHTHVREVPWEELVETLGVDRLKAFGINPPEEE